jgi:hypothetical protein
MVSRSEIVDHLQGVFEQDPITRTHLVEAATTSGARSEVVAVLERLPDIRYHRLADLWPELPDVPVGE